MPNLKFALVVVGLVWSTLGAMAQGDAALGSPVPLLQATHGLADCLPPVSVPPTVEEQRAQAHEWVERGTSCYQSGRCRLPNAYLYDAEIVPRVQKALTVDGGFEDTSIWVEGQRRWVWLKGCVRRPEQAQAAERLVGSLDDVERVINELVVRP